MLTVVDHGIDNIEAPGIVTATTGIHQHLIAAGHAAFDGMVPELVIAAIVGIRRTWRGAFFALAKQLFDRADTAADRVGKSLADRSGDVGRDILAKIRG